MAGVGSVTSADAEPHQPTGQVETARAQFLDRDRLRQVIGPYLEVLFVAILGSASPSQISFWVLGARLDPEYVKPGRTPHGHMNPSSVLHALLRYGLPVQQVKPPHEHGLRYNNLETQFTLTSKAEATLFLTNLLPPHQRFIPEFPRFLDLPPEIRVEIYKMVLYYPRSGVYILPAFGSLSVRVFSNDPHEAWNPRIFGELGKSGMPGRWASGSDFPYWKCPPLRDHLALLRVSRQVYQEAMPVFYSGNTFVYHDHYHLDLTMRRLAPHRRRFLNRMAVYFRHPNPRLSVEKPALEDALRNLVELRIALDHDHFSLGFISPTGQELLEAAPKLLRVMFYGGCPNVVGAWRREAQRLGRRVKIEHFSFDGERFPVATEAMAEVSCEANDAI